jgi:ribosomal protein L16 Arg81 hydroxylase
LSDADERWQCNVPMCTMTSPDRCQVLDFAALVAPANPEFFFSEHWERKPLHQSRGDARYYDSLLTNGDLEGIISSADLRYPAIQLARNGAYLAPEAYTKNIRHGSEFFNGVPDLAQIQSEYRAGSTVVLPALQRTWGPLRELCATLENHFSHAVHANAYLTPGDSPGFTPHYDTHEVFVLQIAGSKRWRIFEPPLSLPHRSQPFTPTGYVLPAPIMELELAPGDLLYLPRGYVHAAETLHGHSAHVTIGVTVYTWIDLVSELVASAKDIASFRTALPPGFATRDDLKSTLTEGLARCMNQLRENGDRERLIDGFLQRIRSSQTRPEKSFQSDVRVIGLQTRLKTPDAGCYRVSMENQNAILEFDGRKFLLPNKIRATVEDMCRRRSFAPGELGGPLDINGKLNLARYLHDERFLTLVD